MITTSQEEIINTTRIFIQELEKIQDHYFEKLTKELPTLTESGKDWLLDYVYNDTYNNYAGFSEFLEKYDCRNAIFKNLEEESTSPSTDDLLSEIERLKAERNQAVKDFDMLLGSFLRKQEVEIKLLDKAERHSRMYP